MQVKDQVLRNLEDHTFYIETLGWIEAIAVGLFDGTNYKDFLKNQLIFDYFYLHYFYLE